MMELLVRRTEEVRITRSDMVWYLIPTAHLINLVPIRSQALNLGPLDDRALSQPK